jgi:hypothetical protein
VPVYLARTYLPDASDEDVRAGMGRAADAADQLRREGFSIRCLDTTFVPADGWLGCRYEADNAVEVRLAVERAVLPFDDIVEVQTDIHLAKGVFE